MLGFDKRTGFPCVAFDDDRFISLLPLTKVQVDQFVWDGGAAEALGRLADDPDQREKFAQLGKSTEMLHELRELHEPAKLHARYNSLDGGQYEFGTGAAYGAEPDISSLRRQAPYAAPCVLAHLATNLQHCATHYEYRKNECAPQPDSPLDSILRWIGARKRQGRIGPLPTLQEYKKIAKQFAALESSVLLQKAKGSSGKRVIRRILQAVYDAQPPNATGLPLLGHGIWELTGDLGSHEVHAVKRAEIGRPIATGHSPFLPCLSEQDSRLVLIEHHPAIGCRPVYPREKVDVLD